MKKRICSVIMAALCMFAFTACNAETGSSESSDTVNNSSSTGNTDSSDENSSTVEKMPEKVTIAALNGPTGMGMVKLMDDDEQSDYGYDFILAGAADEITPRLIKGEIDIACVPANLAAVLYSKTSGEIQTLAVNTLGVLYIVENGNTVNSVADLKGKTVYSAGKGATPEYALNFILKSNNIFDDVKIEWKSEHAECLAALEANPNAVAMLPQPFVTTAMSKNENTRVAVDLNDAWDDLNLSSSLLTGVIIVRKSFAEEYPAAVNQFMSRYGESVKFVNENVTDAAQLVGKYEIVPAAVAEKAIPNCHIVCITGAEMKEKLSGYLQVLYDQLPASVGGAMPGDDFYYGA
ncbi:MAG: ABC transporter substrate-binding protein [Oscillospiraceae bacterium]|nr:ABC transporter substrate-binding protein [Oscillospiraceae bacterium]